MRRRLDLRPAPDVDQREQMTAARSAAGNIPAIHTEDKVSHTYATIRIAEINRSAQAMDKHQVLCFAAVCKKP